VAAAALLGAGQYLYLVHLSDAAPYREAQIDSLGDVAGYVTGGDFKDAMFAFGPRALLVDRVPLVLDYLGLEYGVLLVPMAAGIVRGLWRLPAAPRAVAVQLALLAVGTAVYVLNYDVPDLVVFFLPLFFPLAVFLGIGLEGAVRWLEARPWASPWALRAGAGALAVLVVLFAAGNRSGSSQRGEVAVAEQTERAIDAAGSDAVLLTDDYNDSEYLWYYLLGEGLGEERNLVVADQVTPGEVADYFSSASGPVAVAAESLHVPAPALYTGARRQARDLAEQGLAVTPLDDGVWRVGPPAAG
jgi:hypothetical protein